MKTTPEVEAEIVRLHYAEHWPVGTIATQLEQHVVGGAHGQRGFRVAELGERQTERAAQHQHGARIALRVDDRERCSQGVHRLRRPAA